MEVMKCRTGGKDGPPREVEPVRTVIDIMECCVKGMNSAGSFNEPGP